MAKSLFHSVAWFAALALLGSAAAPLHGAPKKKSPGKTPSKPLSSKSKSSSSKAAAKKPEPPPSPPPLAPGELPLAARAALSMDLKTGAVLYEKNADALEYPASATKILTALLVIEAGDLDRLVTVELSDTKVEPSALEIKPGETYPRRHLLYALLLKSANDVAMALGRDHSGSVAAFAERMTQRAAELGAKESHFTNPHGLHNAHHFTTARDLALIARAAMQNPTFREIVATPEAFLPKGTEMVKLRNHNRLLKMMVGVTGVKTGYTGPAQQVLVSSAIREGCEVLSVVLHTNKPGIWEDSKLLLKDGLVKLGVVLPPGELPSILVTTSHAESAMALASFGMTEPAAAAAALPKVTGSTATPPPPPPIILPSPTTAPASSPPPPTPGGIAGEAKSTIVPAK
jgi:serine-type D-Ala-D-Ala carboxypeptidase (penicillin-binding protein 5/6)